MDKEIKITKKTPRRGDDGYKIVSVRMKEEMLERLDRLAAQTNRSRNELINLLLDSAMEIVKEEEYRMCIKGAHWLVRAFAISISVYSRLRMSSTSRFTP